MMHYPCGKLGDCSFSSFSSIVRTHTQAHRQTRMNALLRRLSSVWVITVSCHVVVVVWRAVSVRTAVRVNHRRASVTVSRAELVHTAHKVRVSSHHCWIADDNDNYFRWRKYHCIDRRASLCV